MSERLEIGDAVEMTEEAIKQKLDGPSRRRTGVVTKPKRTLDAALITVRRDGMKQAEQWAKSFWRKRAKGAA